MIHAPPGLTITPHAITPENSAALQHWLQHDQAIPWEVSLEGRRVAQFGVRYDYQSQHVDLTPVTPLPIVLRQWLPGVTAEYTQCIINEYSPNDAIPFHTDAPLFGPNILVYCLGENRPLLLRRQLQEDKDKDNGGLSFSAAIEHRWSYQMSGEVRTIWEHAVPSGSGRRVSLTFRSLVKGAQICSRKLLHFQTMEMDVVRKATRLEQMAVQLEDRKAQVAGCEKANAALVERVHRLERGEKASIAKERTYRRERSELRLENNNLAKRLHTLEEEIVTFMNNKGFMNDDDGDAEKSDPRKQLKKGKKKRSKKSKKGKKSKKKRHDDESSEICPICQNVRGFCVHTKKSATFCNDTNVQEEISSDDSDHVIHTKKNLKRDAMSNHNNHNKHNNHKNNQVLTSGSPNRHPHSNEYSSLDENDNDNDIDSEEEEARIRGGKVTTSPLSNKEGPEGGGVSTSFSSAVSWLGGAASSTLGAAAWVIGVGGDEDEDEYSASEYSLDSDASSFSEEEDQNVVRKTKKRSSGPSRGRNMLYLKRQAEARLNNQNTASAKDRRSPSSKAAAASASRRMQRGKGISASSSSSSPSSSSSLSSSSGTRGLSVKRGGGNKGSAVLMTMKKSTIKSPSTAMTGISSTMKKVVRRGGGTKAKPENSATFKTMKVLRGKGVQVEQ